MGRPTKLTPEVKRKLLRAIREGNYLNVACGLAGISYETFNGWMKRGDRESSGPYVQFSQAVRQAELEAEQRLVATLKRASAKSWMAAAWLLSHRFHERWADRQKVDVQLAMRQEAERVAAETGLSVDEVLAEAERLLGAKR